CSVPFLLLLRRSARRRSAAATSTAAATRSTAAATAPTAPTAASQSARRCAGTRCTVFGEAATAFGIKNRILFAFDAGGFGLLVSRRTAFESLRHVQIAPERVGYGHWARQSNRIFDDRFISNGIGILGSELFDDVYLIAMHGTICIPPSGGLAGCI